MASTAPPAQTYATHAHQPRQTLIAALFALAAFVMLVIEAVREPSLLHVALVCLCCAVIMLVGMSRTYIVRLQDRIIRLEMRLRLERLGRAGDFARLAHPQVVALRFASDEELPELIDRALSERLSSQQIKQAVKDWQADWYRT
jgi:predicted lysophospholipase L1 biosynthesis ABC-type transport system permease subunit